MERAKRPKTIPSTGRVEKYGGTKTRVSLGPFNRFIFEGEFESPENDIRNALVTVKDLANHKIEGLIILIFE